MAEKRPPTAGSDKTIFRKTWRGDGDKSYGRLKTNSNKSSFSNGNQYVFQNHGEKNKK